MNFGKKIGKYFLVRWLAFLVLAVLVWLRFADPASTKFVREVMWFDLLQVAGEYKPAERKVAIVDIDEESLAALGQWPWSRYDIAIMVSNLMQLGARVVGFDVVFAEADKLSPGEYAANNKRLPPEVAAQLAKMDNHDAIFGQVISQSKVVMGGATIYRDLDNEKDKKPKPARYATKGGSIKKDIRDYFVNYPDVVTNIDVIETKASGFGVFSLETSPDGIVRKVPAVVRVGAKAATETTKREPGVVYPALTLEMMRVAHRSKGFLFERLDANSGLNVINIRSKVNKDRKPVQVRTDEHGAIWVRFAKHDPGMYISAKDVIQLKADDQEMINKLVEKVRGKYVLVGTSAEGLKDIRATPLETGMPGVEVHAQILNMVENDDHLVRPSIAKSLELFVILVAGVILVSVVPMLGAATTALFYVPFCATLLGGSWYLYMYEDLLLDGLSPVFATLVLFMLLVYQKYAREQAQKKQVRGAFAQYLSPALVEQLADEPERLVLGGETKSMTFLFCDIRGFTPISESFKGDPQGLTQLINKFLTPMTDIIMGNHGTIDKYMGDCIMAFWNAPLTDEEHPRHACESALLMQSRLVELNAQLKIEAEEDGRKFIPINIGIGVNTGECVVGNMGSAQRFDYSVLGDAVNLGARLEGQSKSYGVINVVGEETMPAIQDFATIELDLIAVKGKDEAVRIFSMLGGPEMAGDQTYLKLKAESEALMKAYFDQRWSDAKGHLANCREIWPDLVVLWDLYDERLEAFEADPPGDEWDGVFRATSK